MRLRGCGKQARLGLGYSRYKFMRVAVGMTECYRTKSDSMELELRPADVSESYRAVCRVRCIVEASSSQ